MEKYVAIVSVIDGTARTHMVSPSDGNVATALEQLSVIARTWITDEVGRNNFVDTLSSVEPLDTLPLGYALRRRDAAIIDLYHIAETVEVGWVSTSRTRVPTLRGFFAVTLADRAVIDHSTHEHAVCELQAKIQSLLQEIDLLREDAKYAVRNSQTPRHIHGRNDIQDEMIRLIREFDKSKLRRIGSAPVHVPCERATVPAYTGHPSGYDSDCSDSSCASFDDAADDAVDADEPSHVEIIDDNDLPEFEDAMDCAE